MKTLKTTLLALPLLLLCAVSFCACDDEDTYADRLKRERKQIQGFLQTGVQVMADDSLSYILNVPGPINVISEDQFYANDSTTDVSRNEFVLFEGSGVYMQIVRKGSGSPLADGERATVLSRYVEFNIANDTIQSSNKSTYYAPYPEVMTCTNTSGLMSGRFTSGLMYTLYGTSTVPSGWLIPLPFINLGRQDTPEGGTALVRLIVPAAQGQSDAGYNIYPCFYEISYQRGR